MATIKPIRTEADYEAALERIEEIFNAEVGSPEENELNILVDLVELYESKNYPIDPPDPVEAIKFRMEQAGLKQRDLIPFIGSRAKVSEVLSGKRSITMPMARALHQHLGISADVLLQKKGTNLENPLDDIEWEKFPLKRMAQLGWIPEFPDLKRRARELIQGLIEKAGGEDAARAVALFRKNNHRYVNARTDKYALKAWCLRVLAIANQNLVEAEYETGTVTPDFLRDVAQISWSEGGPLTAKEFLEKHGISLVVLEHLPKTYLDGAALRLSDGRPVVGLTLRYDRTDNFWFCLLHELAHIGLHIDKEKGDIFVDDMTLRNAGDLPKHSQETEADRWAEEALIPKSVWEISAARLQPTPLNVLNLAGSLKIHPAIIAGRVRYEKNNYRLLSQFVGSGKIRQQFDFS